MTPKQFKEIRKELGYTQDELSSVIGYSRQHVINYEKGNYDIEKTVSLLMLFMSHASKRMLKEILEGDL